MDPRTYTHMQYGFPVHAPAENRLLPTTQRSPAPDLAGAATPGLGNCTGCGMGFLPEQPDMTDKQKKYTMFVGVASGVGGLLLGTLGGYFFWGRK